MMNGGRLILGFASFLVFLSLISLWLILALLDGTIAMLLSLSVLFPIWFASLLFLRGKTNGIELPLVILGYFLLLDGLLVRLWGEFSSSSGYGLVIIASIVLSLICAAMLFRKDVRDALQTPGEEGEPVEAVT